MVCVKNKRGPEGSRESEIHHANATKALSHTFGDAKKFYPKNLEGGSDSTNYTNIQTDYVGKSSKIKLLEARVMAYDTRDLIITPTLVDKYAGAVKEHWRRRVATGAYLL